MNTRIAVVGGGWRARYYGRLATTLSDDFELVGMSSRTEETRQSWHDDFGCPTHGSVEELVAREHPHLVVVAVSYDANAAVIGDAVATGAHVLAETPPAADLDELRHLWADVGHSRRVQVAEQYTFLPGHAARRAVVDSGSIGQVTQAQVSSTHGYHAVALMRHFLGAGVVGAERNPGSFGPATVMAHRHLAPLLDPEDRSGWRTNPEETPTQTTLAVLDLPEGTGLYDFSDNQWHNRLLHRRILLRGTRGEVNGDSVLTMPEPRAIVRAHIERAQSGLDLDLDGWDTESLSLGDRVLYRNPFPGARLADEEIAMATLLRAAGRWSVGEGIAPYPLEQGMQDQLLSLAIEESARSGLPVHTGVEAWGRAGV